MYNLVDNCPKVEKLIVLVVINFLSLCMCTVHVMTIIILSVTFLCAYCEKHYYCPYLVQDPVQSPGFVVSLFLQFFWSDKRYIIGNT